IVQGHQGHLTIDSEDGQGTSVGLYLPRLRPEVHVEKVPDFQSGEVVEPESTPGHNILVVDDEEAVMDVVRRFLESAGHNVTCCASGAEALDLVAQGQLADLVILDLMIPREDGVVTFQRLRQRRPNIPVLLCTGLLQGDPTPQILQAGGVGLLRKPFRMNELWYAVNQTLAGETTVGTLP